MTGPHRRRALAVLVAVVLVAVIAVVAASRGSRPPTPFPAASPPAQNTLPARAGPGTVQTGASVNLLFNTPGLPASLIAAQLRALSSTGATLARSDALWEASEPRAPRAGVHAYDWAFDDRVAGALAEAGLRWLPIIDYSAPWAQSIPGQDHSPPRSDADYGAYAAALAARYGAGGSFWRSRPGLRAEPVQTFEIWNEPDNGEFWTPGPDATGYARLYATARAAIDAVDPAAQVIVGGLTDPAHFLPAMLTALPALRGHIDGVAVHPYGRPHVVLSRVYAARLTLDALGLRDLPLYVTEVGWTIHPVGVLDYVPGPRRAAFILQTLSALAKRSCGVAAVVLYTWYSPGRDPANSQEWYGISSATGASAADTAAFARGRRALAGSGAARACAG
jgi:hypothetical protein